MHGFREVPVTLRVLLRDREVVRCGKCGRRIGKLEGPALLLTDLGIIQRCPDCGGWLRMNELLGGLVPLAMARRKEGVK
jgi:hypothetical protein